MTSLTGRIARLLAGLALVLVTVLVPSTASAIGPDCKEAPTADVPGSGVTGPFDYMTHDKDANGETWVGDHPSYQHYGYAGLRWNNYDLGCGLGLARNPGALIGTEVGNWLFMLPKIAVSLTNFVVHFAFNPTFLDVFDPLVIKATSTLRTALFNKWAGLAVAVGGLVLLWRVRKVQMSHTLSVVGWAVVVFTMASAVFSWPLVAGHTTDKVVTGVLGAVSSGINGSKQGTDPADEVGQNLVSAVLFQQWKTGEFGDGNSEIANKYARPMWESQTLTWADKALVEKDPDGAGKRLLEFKKEQFEKTAAKIKDEDPAAYEYLQGKRGEERFGAAFMATLGAVVTIPFLLISCLMVLSCFVLVRFAVIFFPVVATLSVNYQFRSMLKGMLNTVAAAVVNTIVFGAGASVTILAIGVLMSPENKLPIALRMIMIALTTVIMWSVLKPFRKLTQMVSKNHNPFGNAAGAVGDHYRGVTRQLTQLGKQALASYAGNSLALKKRDKKKRDEDAEGKDEKVSEETTVTEPQVDTEPETQDAPAAEPQVELPPARQPAAALGTRPETADSGPYERPAATAPDPVDGSPVRGKVATRPAHPEIGPFAASQTGEAVVPIQGAATPPGEQRKADGDQQAPPVVRPEYAGGSDAPEVPPAGTGKPGRRDDVWQPGDPEPVHAGDAELIDLRGTATIDESGQEVWPLYNPDNGVSFDAQTVDFGDYQAPQADTAAQPGPQTPQAPQPPAGPSAPAGGQ